MTRESNIGLTLKDLAAPDVLWASAFGAGFCRPAPGTWGSVLAVGVWWFGLSALPVWQQLLVVLFYFCSGWWVSRRICLRYQVDDAPQIVADEVAGMWLALAFLPQAVLPQAWWLALLALVLFRLLDILKPGPIGWLDREVKGGLGVMLDDLVAGAVAGLVCLLAVYFVT